MRFRVVTLDLDGTLWDSGPALARAEQAVFDWLQARYPRITAGRTPADLVAHRHAVMARRPGLRHDYTRLRRAALAALAAEAGYEAALVEAAMELFIAERSRVDLYADTLPVLERLRRRFRVIALTNGNADVNRAGVGHLLELALSPAQTGTAKPDPGVFDHVRAHCGVDSGAIVHVGDEPHTDVECARRAGVAAVWVNRGGAAWPALPPPAARIASLAELERAIDTLAGRAARDRSAGQ